jgi:hypothetical protein
MRFQLVLQFPAESLEEFGGLVAFEDDLAELLGPSCSVDGHDFGSGQMNIFVHTDEPMRAFDVIKNSGNARARLKHLIAAFRPMRGEKYTILWPPSAKEFRVI